MKVQIGHTTAYADTTDIPPNWHPINSPPQITSFLLAGIVGLMVPVVLVLWLTFLSVIDFGNSSSQDTTRLWVSVGAALVLFIPLHELLHAVAIPKAGLSEQKKLVIWPRKLRIGVYFNGCMTRRHWIFMRVTPLIGLSFFPLVLLTIFRVVTIPYSLQVFLQVLMIVNGIGSGGDPAAILIVLKQVPPKTSVCFRGGRAFWHLSSSRP